jgi:DNA primase
MFKVIEYLEENAIPFSTSGKNISQGWIGIQCPFCSDRSNHLGINLHSTNFSCFVCGTKGSPIKLIRAIENKTYHQAKETLEKFSTRVLTVPETTSTPSAPFQLPNEAKTKLMDTHRNYLLSRNFSEKTYLNYKLLCAGPTGRYKLRLIVPVFVHGEMVTFTSRDITNRSPYKYLSCPDDQSKIPIKNTIYNLDNAKNAVIVVEGVTDVWRIGNGAVGIYGTNYTAEQIKLLSSFNRVFVLFDSAANSQAEKLGNDLSAFTNVEILYLSKGDPADLTENDIKILKQKISV